jgi:hypothetical protein
MSDRPSTENRHETHRAEDSRKQRLKAALKANLMRRKDQARLREADVLDPGSASQQQSGQD